MTNFSAVTERQSIMRELRASHEELVAFMDAVHRVTETSSIDDAKLGLARWKLSQARRRNKALVHSLLESLSPAAASHHGEFLGTLRNNSAETMQTTARHSSRWTLDAVKQDPHGYRQAIHRLRKQWMNVIGLEQKLIDISDAGDQAAAA